MKRKYEYPKMEIIEFDTKDVITTSGVSDDDFLNGLDHVIDINNGNSGRFIFLGSKITKDGD